MNALDVISMKCCSRERLTPFLLPGGRALLAATLAIVALVAHAVPVFDDFTDPAAWTGPIYEYGNHATGDAFIRNGILTVRHAPVAKWHTVSMRREWRVALGTDTWLHFRFRAREMLLGADMYTTVTVGDRILIQFGVNGEQHWVQGALCQAKAFDDELFWGSPLIAGEASGKNTDIRVAVAEALRGRLRYTDWVVFSVKYEVRWAEARVRLFVNGHEIVYRDIDAGYPNGDIDNHVRADAALPKGPVPVVITLANFTDGDLYGDVTVNGGAGVRWEHAFAEQTPAIPHPEDPKQAINRNADFQWDWVMVVNEAEAHEVRKEVEKLIREERLAEDVARRVGLLPTTVSEPEVR
jgi:hypothetical protein